MVRFFKKLIAIGLFLLGAGVPGDAVYAENIISGLSVSPAFQEIVFDQQDTKKEFIVSVSNTTKTLVTLYIAVFDFGSLDESGGVAFLGASNDLGKKYALASWVRPEKDVITLAPGDIQKILVTIENRSDLSPGGHYGALTFRTEDETRTGDTKSTVAVNQLFSTLIFVKKVGGAIYDLELKGTEYRNSSVRFQDTVRLRFQNSGNVHVVPRGIVSIADPFGRIVAKGIINRESALILPETIRVYPVRLSTLAMSFMPGRYTLEIVYRYDGKEDFVLVTETYFLVPALFIGGVLTFTLGCGGFYLWRKKKTKKSAIL